MEDTEKEEGLSKIVVVDRGILEQLKGGMSPTGEGGGEQPLEEMGNGVCGLSCKAN